MMRKREIAMALLIQKPLVMSQTWSNRFSFFGALKFAFVLPGTHMYTVGRRAS
jgi:hypothetical protein